MRQESFGQVAFREMKAYVEKQKSRWVEGIHEKDNELLLGFPLRLHLAEEVLAIVERRKRRRRGTLHEGTLKNAELIMKFDLTMQIDGL